MSKLKVLMIPDSYGWAHEFNARGVKKHSRHNITVRPVHLGGLTADIVKAHDVVFVFSRWIWDHLHPKVRYAACRTPLIIYCCGSYFKKPPHILSLKYFAGCTERFAVKARALGIQNVAVLKEGVDTGIFKPVKKKKTSRKLIVGWAGNTKSPLKRYGLVKKLIYPVKVKADHDIKFRFKGCSRQKMVDFYNSLDVYLMLMKSGGSFGVGLTVLEAMACGITCITTNYCSVGKINPKKWLVPMTSSRCVKEVNRKLKLLDRNRELLVEAGKRNVNFIRKNRSWKTVVKEWDKLFEKAARK